MSTREIVLDTETTGLDPDRGDRIVEIGCVELENHLPTGRVKQFYVNPEREIPPEATAIHGITDQFLIDKPVFSQVYGELMEFLKGARLVIHNAEFDIKFLNWELRNVGHDVIPWNMVVDTVTMARKKFPGSPANLDALCRRFGIDNSGREFHGALLDSQLLSEVYLELLGGRQHGLQIIEKITESRTTLKKNSIERVTRVARDYKITDEEEQAHGALLEKLKNPLWAN
ncbi:MAG: DNA polymerase III subunit epsilon [Alphaproteobacteria bacterium]